MKKLVLGVGGSVLLASAGIMGGFLMDSPDVVVVEKFVEVPVEKIVEVPVEVEKEVVVEVEKEVLVEVDNGMMSWAFERLEDKLIIDDATEILAELKAEDDALNMVFNNIDERELFDFMEDEGLVLDEDEVSIIKVYSDFEDVEVIKSDFDDEEYEFKIKFKVDDDGVKKYFFVSYIVEDGEVSLEDVE